MDGMVGFGWFWLVLVGFGCWFCGEFLKGFASLVLNMHSRYILGHAADFCVIVQPPVEVNVSELTLVRKWATASTP